MKRIFIIIPVIFVVLIGGALFAPKFIDWSAYKDQAESQIQKLSGYDVEIAGDVGLSVLPRPYVYLSDVRILPQNGFKKNLLTLKTLNVNLALLPLLSGEIKVQSVSLDTPVIYLETNETNGQNWMTSEIKAIMDGKNDETAAASGKTPAISVDEIEISGGQLTYHDAIKDEAQVIENINLEVDADSLMGPYNVDGEVTYKKNTVEFQAKTEEFLPENKEIALNISIQDQNNAVRLKYAGVLGFLAGIDVQGELDANIDLKAPVVSQFLPKTLPAEIQAASIKGLITGSQDKVAITNAEVVLGDFTFKGNASSTLNPMEIKADLKANNALDLSSFVQKTNNNKPSGTQVAFDGLVPQTLNLPANLRVDINIAAPQIVLKQQSLENVTLTVGKTEKSMSLGVSAEQIPGKGQFNLQSSLDYAERSISQSNGSEILSDPILKIDGQVKSQNLKQMMNAFGVNLPETLPDSYLKAANISVAAELDGDRLRLVNGDVTLGDERFRVSGSVVSPKLGKRGQITLDVAANNFDASGFTQTSSSEKPFDVESAVKSLKLPYNVNFDFGIQSLKAFDREIKGVRMQGAIDDRAVTLTNISAQNLAGTSVKLSGGIKNYPALKDVTLNIEAQTEDIKAFSEAFSIDTSQIPPNVKSLKATVSVSGETLANLTTQADLRAIGGHMTVKGSLLTPLTDLRYKDMRVQLSHENMNQLIRVFNPGFEGFSTWSKPMELKTSVQYEGQKLSLPDLKGNIAGTDVSGVLSIDQTQSKPNIQGQFTLGDLVLKKSLNPPSVRSVRPERSMAPPPKASQWSKQQIDMSGLKAFSGKLELKAKSIVYDAWEGRDIDVTLSLVSDVLKIEAFRSRIFGGDVSIDGVVSSPSPSSLKTDINLKITQVSLEPIVNAFVGSSLVSGRGMLDLTTSISTAGGSQHDLITNLSGTGEANGKDIVLEGFDLSEFAKSLSSETKPGDTLQGLWRGSTSGGSTSFDALDGAYDIRQGLVNISKLDLIGPKADIATKGRVDLPRWYIDTVHTVSLKEGEKDIPSFDIKLSGPLDNPAQTFGQGVLEDYFKRKINRKLQKLIQDKLNIPGLTPPADAADGNVPQDGGTPREIKPEEAFRGLLEGLIQ